MLENGSEYVTGVLAAVQVVGAVLAALFSAVYLLGLPTTEVRHSEPAFRLALSTVGIIFIVLVLSAVVAAFVLKRKG
jgi:hypothetical protein